MKMIVADGLTKRYGSHLAVDHVSFEVEEGEIFGFLGPNGAGKTTTIKMLNTLLKPTDGRALIDGHDVSEESGLVRRKVGLVPQDLTLDRDMTGRQNLKIQATLYDVPGSAARTRTEELLKLVGLGSVGDKEVGTYSWGMQKRLELVMGLVHNPSVLFLDEPTLGLDAQSRALIWEYIRKLNSDFKVTVFMTTHYLEEADELCSRVAIIDSGKVKVEGSPQELKRSLGGDRVTIRLSRPADEVAPERVLEGIDGVVKVSSKGFDCFVEATESEKTVPKLVLALAAKASVESVKVEKTNLNQVFLQQTRGTLDSGDPEDEYRELARDRLLRERT